MPRSPPAGEARYRQPSTTNLWINWRVNLANSARSPAFLQNEVLQRYDDAIVAPGPILLSELEDQRCRRLGSWRTSHCLAVFGTVELPRHQTSMPGQDRLGTDDPGEFSQPLAPETFADLSQPNSIRIGRSNSAFDPGTQDLVLSAAEFVSLQEFFVNGTGDVGRSSLPGHLYDLNTVETQSAIRRFPEATTGFPGHSTFLPFGISWNRIGKAGGVCPPALSRRRIWFRNVP